MEPNLAIGRCRRGARKGACKGAKGAKGAKGVVAFWRSESTAFYVAFDS